MSPFDFREYKTFVRAWVENQPRKGRGLYAEMARRLDTNSVTISQIFRGSRELTSEQALVLSDFFELSNIETEYFILLVQIERAGTDRLKNFYRKKITLLKEQAKSLKNRVKIKSELDQEAKNRFYSEWYFSGIRLHCARQDVNSVSDLVRVTGLSSELVSDVVDFLLLNGLIEKKEGGFDVGVQSTHLGNKSLLINHHRRNWRTKALLHTSNERANDLFYSGPMVLSHQLVADFRKRLLSLISQMTKDVAEADCEQTACLNVDWFEF